jgi:hypothetical protein
MCASFAPALFEVPAWTGVAAAGATPVVSTVTKLTAISTDGWNYFQPSGCQACARLLERRKEDDKEIRELREALATLQLPEDRKETHT